MMIPRVDMRFCIAIEAPSMALLQTKINLELGPRNEFELVSCQFSHQIQPGYTSFYCLLILERQDPELPLKKQFDGLMKSHLEANNG